MSCDPPARHNEAIPARALNRTKGTTHGPHAVTRPLVGDTLPPLGGLPSTFAEELLRHASPTTTALYTLFEDSERPAAVMGLPDYTST